MYAVNATPAEFVADERVLAPGSHDIADAAEAMQRVDAYLRQRLAAAVERWPGRPVLQLSGGIDSILIASYLADIAPAALAVTYSSGDADEELERASRVAALYGFEHCVVQPDVEEFDALLADTVRALAYPEPWEIAAGVVLVAVDRAARERGADGALLSGAGADALFMGGKRIQPRAGERLAAAWDEALRANVSRNFTRRRFIPDFYERLIPQPERHIQVWQTHAAVELAQGCDPALFQRDGEESDKLLFRELAVERGVPADVANAGKNPMQVSSGVVGDVVAAARRRLAADFGERTYSSPLDEDLEFTVARLYLERLRGEQR